MKQATLIGSAMDYTLRAPLASGGVVRDDLTMATLLSPKRPRAPTPCKCSTSTFSVEDEDGSARCAKCGRATRKKSWRV